MSELNSIIDFENDPKDEIDRRLKNLAIMITKLVKAELGEEAEFKMDIDTGTMMIQLGCIPMEAIPEELRDRIQDDAKLDS